MLGEDIVDEQAAILKKACGQEPLRLSAVANIGVKQALGQMARALGQIVDEDDEQPTEEGWSPLG